MIYMYLVLSILSALSPGSAIIAYPLGQVHTTDAIVDLKGGEVGRCHSVEERERARNEMHQSISSIITTLAETATSTVTAMTTPGTPAPTMTSTYTCNGSPGWRRVAFINMTDTSHNCPTGLSLTSYSKRTCGRSHTTWGGCSSTTFNVEGAQYSQVCGRIRGYQFGETTAFYHSGQGIDSNYVAGISLTHGVPGSREHIWTFAAGLDEADTSYPDQSCPCDPSQYSNVYIAAFVGDDYFCESGLKTAWSHDYIFYPDDVLWDGQDCTSTSTCCQFNNPPWFTKNLTSATTDDIELRICTSYDPMSDDIPIELIELHVK